MEERSHTHEPATGTWPQAFWCRPLAELAAELDSPDGGLSSARAWDRLDAAGRNELASRPRGAAVAEYAKRFRNPLVLLLLAAGVASAVLGDRASFVVILLIVAASVTLDFWQERRAGDAAERLRRRVALQVSVRRDGAVGRLPAAELVPGDRVLLAAGDLVPADGRVVAARDLFVQQSVLTGESFPVEKRAMEALPAASTDIVDAHNAAFMGSSVLSGSGELLVCATGRATRLGEIAESLSGPDGPTDFEIGTRRFGQMIVRTTLVLVLFVVFVHLLAARPLLDTFMFAIALAVGLTPELLPMIVSVTLARGALRLADSQVIVKRLAAVENLGSMDVLCTDKTGTLTEGVVSLERHVDLEGRASARVLELAALNSRFETGLRSPLDDAILAAPGFDLAGWRKIDEVPFGFERRRVSVLVERAGERLLVVKGAPEHVLALCTEAEVRGADGGFVLIPMDGPERARAAAHFEALSREGQRALAIAWRTVPPDHAHAGVDDETGLVFSGFVTFADPPKASAAEALAALRRSHVQVRVLTGDNEWVTLHLCERLGLPVRAHLTGSQVDELDDAALQARVRRTDVFCRLSPPQKTRVIRALRAGGHVVGFVGDGVNDAPSLRLADVGISVDGAVDVAKEAASLVLLQNDLRVLHAGVLEGRRSFANVMKYVTMATSANLGNMVSMAGASLIVPFLPMLPVQILLNNLLYDTSELALPLDEVDADATRRPQRWNPEFIRRLMVTLGLLSSLFDMATFALLLHVAPADATLLRTGWFVESVASQVLVIFVVRTRANPWRSRPHPLLVASSAAAVVAAVALPFTPAAEVLGFGPLPAGLLAALAALVAIYLASAEIVKRAALRRRSRSRGRVRGPTVGR